MAEAIARILPVLQLTRIALVFTAVSDIWVIALLSHAYPELGAEPGLPLAALLVCTAAVAVGTYAFGMVLNDVMDARHDRVFAPGRPIPSGRIGHGGAIAIAIGALLVAVAGSVPLGAISTMLCLLSAALILFYDTVGKNLAGTGVVTLGLIRAMNMLNAAPSLGYVWPIWLTMSHVIGLSAAGYRLEGKRPLLEGRSVWVVVGGWALGTVGLLVWMDHRGVAGPDGGAWLWVGPLVAAVLFIIIAMRTVRGAPSRRTGGGLLMKRGLLWLIVYDAAWLLGGGLWWQGALVGSLLPLAWGMMMLTRHLKVLVGEAPTFRRDPGPRVV